jgi:hypothetical protein
MHPSDLSLKQIMRRMSDHDVKNLDSLMLSIAPGALLHSQDHQNLQGLFQQYWADASPDHFQLKAAGAKV